MWSMIKGEFRHIIHNRLLLLSVTVICFIPFLYSIFFLKSVWDPYGSTRNLPVAVVNKDIPVEYQGRKMDVGKQTVNELKKNHQLKWEFVSAKEAKYGMSHRKYYAVVTIPKDFSENATTVLQKHPKTMKLHYQTNGSLNYIGQVIAQTGMTRLNEKIRAQVTNAYATVMFKQLHVVGKGMNKAADGAQQIGTGMVTLSDGVNRYVAGVSQVNNGVQTLRVSVAPLASGAQQLATGSQTLANSIMQYTGGVSLLGNGVGQLMANSGALNSGASQLRAGVGRYTAGVSDLNAGLGKIANNSAKLQAGAKELKDSSGNFESLNEGSQRINTGVQQVAQLSDVLRKSNIMGTLTQAQDLSGQVESLQGSLQDVESTMATMQGIDQGKINSALQGIQQASGQAANGLNSSLNTVKNNSSNTASQAQAIAAAVNSDPKADQATKDKVNAAVGQIVKDQQSNGEALQSAQTSVKGLQQAMLNAQDSLAPTLQTLQGLQGKLPQLSGDLDKAKSVITQTQTLMSSLNSPENQQLIAEMSNNPKMAEQLQALSEGTQKLANGTAQLAQKTNSINELADGINQYTTAVNAAADGSSQLVANSGTLQSGANQLASGIGQYTAGVGQLGNGIAQLNANSGALNSGAAQLAGALGQLNGQVPALVAGVNQLAAGTQQLQDNSPALISGIARLNAGASQLATSLAGGAKQINGIKTSPRTAKMFAEPTALKHTDYSYVPNYGHALAPYVLSLAIYVGALVFNFVYPIRRVAEFGKAPIAWWASKVTVGSLVVTAMAIAEDAIMMACGLTVIHPVAFFATTICFGLASMAIVMFLSMLFDNPGRFFAMVLLMLQLGGSGGTFPMEITMKFYNVIHWYLPMTYSILGLRDSISGGLGAHYTMFCNTVLIVIAIVFYALLLVGMIWLQHHHYAGRSELDNNQELLGPEGDYDGMHLQQRRPNQGDNGEQ
ncbi:YhgE/Pip domain-containing protein [Limosilactobacillus reuteri]|uniref:YhgE/Pip domain-containing protein n=1 Tax=Limosilactobacillus reuteri TaxID=1598 RepID=UPI001E53FF0F|nr:YhgE/Pip domain-containing protein [Limosilactobacillus reuteri]MCC4324353.1 YhgE/Pip domain-containing protein [Limosilactobacillus reuteri]MCC4334404.1 YhgE/Pip domain-containing protein [Limosilactobacillus reuteri]